MGMRLGVGITTRLPRDLIRYGRTQVELLTPELCDLVIVHDDAPGFVEYYGSGEASWRRIDERLGIARAKNLCLAYLQDCDYIILLDDDIWPVANDWAALLVRAHELSRIHHFIYIPSSGTRGNPWSTPFQEQQTFHYDGLALVGYDHCAGCMLFLTRTVVERVGGFGVYPGVYGYEHAGYSQRIAGAGLQGNAGPYVTVAGLADKLYSIDFQGLPAHLGGYHVASALSTEEAAASVNLNQRAYTQDTVVYRPLVDPLSIPIT